MLIWYRFMVVEEDVMSLEDGKEYTAYCVEERVNIGGWVSYESDARRNRDEPRRVFRRLICLSYAAMSDLSRAA